MNADGPKRLLAEIDRKLAQRLEGIRRQEETDAAELETQFRQRLQLELDTRRQAHARELARRNARRIRQATQHARERLWDSQKACVESLLEEIRDALKRPDRAASWLTAWLSKIRKQMDQEDAEMELEVAPSWRKAAQALTDIRVRTRPMPGGAILRDEQRGIEVDASWERRLHDLMPTLWRRWHEQISGNH